MKSLFVVLSCLFALTLSTHARSFTFRDGTVLEADIYNQVPFAPASDGITLQQRKMIYFHHYPLTAESYAPPQIFASNPNYLPSCVPSRIAFIHFSRPTLLALRKDYGDLIAPPAPLPTPETGSQGHAILFSRVGGKAPAAALPVYPPDVQAAIRDIIVGIDRALEEQARRRPDGSLLVTHRWQGLVEEEMSGCFGRSAVWGKHLARDAATSFRR